MGMMETFAPAPPAAITRVLATFGRRQLEGFIAVAIELLDLADGDPEAEEGDAEDSFAFTPMALHMTRRVPGDITADADDTAYCEWGTLHGSIRRAGRLNGKMINPMLGAPHEDDEDGGDTEPNGDEQDANGDEGDTNNAEDEIFAGRLWGISGPGCEVSDAGEYDGGEHRLQCEPVPILELNDN